MKLLQFTKNHIKEGVTMELNAKDLSRYLKRVYLNGNIKEVILHTSENSIGVQAVDLSNSLFINVISPFGFVDIGALGIPNLDLLIKYLDSVGDNTVTVSRPKVNGELGERLVFKTKNTFKMLLQDPDTIPTAREDEGEENPVEVLERNCKYFVHVTEEDRQDILKYARLTSPVSVTIYLDKKGKCTIKGGHTNEHQWEVTCGKAIDEHGDPAEISDTVTSEVYGKYVTAIFNALEHSPENSYIALTELDDYPVLIKQDTDVWAMLPATDREEQEESEEE